MAEPYISLIGNPNSGKTTVFNSLTGSRQQVGNWPGVTTDKKTCLLYTSDAADDMQCVDLGGRRIIKKKFFKTKKSKKK